MGSKNIWKLGYRCGFAFIGVIGQKSAIEQVGSNKNMPVSVTQIFQLNINIQNAQDNFLMEDDPLAMTEDDDDFLGDFGMDGN